jgi:putative methionine-R-sulfoxide reductase with GAF domain
VTPDELVEAVAAIAVASHSPAERATRIAGAIREAGSHRWVGVYEVTDADVAILGYAGPGAPAHPRFPRTRGLTATAVATGRAVVVDDVTGDPRYLTAFDSTRSEMIVPVVGDRTTVIGTIDVESEHVAAFGDAERELVGRLAHAVVPLFERASRASARPSGRRTG